MAFDGKKTQQIGAVVEYPWHVSMGSVAWGGDTPKLLLQRFRQLAKTGWEPFYALLVPDGSGGYVSVYYSKRRCTLLPSCVGCEAEAPEKK